MSKTTKPPAHLSLESRRLWKRLFEDFEIDSAGEMLLVATLEAKDRRDQARVEIEKTGAVVKDRWGQLKPNPWAGIERDAAATMMKGWRLLGFDLAPATYLGMGRK